MKPTTIALIAGAAYLAYSSGLLDSLLGDNEAPVPTGPTPSTNTNAGGGLSPTTLRSLILAAGNVDANQMYTFDQWNTLYQGVRGVQGPDALIVPGYTNENRGRLITVDEYLNLARPLGVSGLMAFPVTPSVYKGIGRNRLYNMPSFKLGMGV